MLSNLQYLSKRNIEKRWRRYALFAVAFALAAMVLMPLANYALYSWAHDRAYNKFVAPQQGNQVVVLNSRLLPTFKDAYLKTILDKSPNEFILVFGNSSQFHLRESVFRDFMACDLKTFYNMSYHSGDYLDAQYFFKKISIKITDRWTVLLGIYPDMFTKIARSATPSIDHPWNNLSLWAANIRDGNTSIASLFPRILNIEWPLTPQTWFPFIRYYEDTYEFALNGKPDEYLYPDGSVQFFGADEMRRKRIAGGHSLDASNIRMIAARNLNSPFDGRLLLAFQDTVSKLLQQGATVIAYEAQLTEYLGGARWASDKFNAPYIKTMRDLERQHQKFQYLDKTQTWTNVPEKYWIDGAHVSFEGGGRIVKQLSRLIGEDELCRSERSDVAD